MADQNGNLRGILWKFADFTNNVYFVCSKGTILVFSNIKSGQIVFFTKYCLLIFIL
jgi:hypothetical protein